MDKITINDLTARCIIGVNDDERREKQDVVITIILTVDLRKACETDNFNDTVDYRAIKKTALAIAESSHYYLIEALADHIARACLDFNGVKAVLVRVEKPSALRFARSVNVELYRERP